jgi:ADP-ribose pyrophosphatase YjhB (NUDIX family)
MGNNNRFQLHAAVYLVLLKDKKILLLRRFNTGWEDGKYTLISGHIDGNETIAQAMSREAFEEAGIKIEPENLKVSHVMHRKSNKEYIDFFLTSTAWIGTPKIKEKNKADDMKWFEVNVLPVNLLPHVKYALSEIERGNTFSEYDFD